MSRPSYLHFLAILAILASASAARSLQQVHSLVMAFVTCDALLGVGCPCFRGVLRP